MSLARSEIARCCPAALGSEPRDDTLVDGLRQRARLFELILADLSGLRTILKRDLLPSILVPGESLRCEIGGLRAYAAELVRCSDGIWRVAGDLAAGVGNHSSAYLLEAPALAGFLPGLCRFLLGAPLQLASVPSRWLADPGSLHEVTANRDRWAIIDAFARGKATRLAALTPAQRNGLQDRVGAAPWRFVARMLTDGDSQCVALARTEEGFWMNCDQRPAINIL